MLGRLLSLVVGVFVIGGVPQALGQVALLHIVLGIYMRILVRLGLFAAGAVRVDIFQVDLGAVASSTAASARGSLASGRPSCTAASTQALVTAMAWG